MSKINEKLFDECPKFFLGANAAGGFDSRFCESYDVKAGDRAFILKGGPGTGKSTLMKRVAEKVLEKGHKAEIIYCSSDPESLDAVIINSLGTVIADGTMPHVMEAKYPGACEMLVPLGECFDTRKLTKNKEEIINLTDVCSRLHQKASRLITGAGRLLDDSFSIDFECTDIERALKYACRAADTLFPKKDNTGSEKIRFLSGITPDGIIVFNNTLPKYANKIIAIEDELGAASSVIMMTLRAAAISRGYDIITCPCAINPERKIDHIIIPEIKTALCTVNSYMDISCDNTRRIHAKRFHKHDELRKYRYRLTFNRKGINELLSGATNLLYDARKIHTKLETYYVDAMDFNASEIYMQSILEQII